MDKGNAVGMVVLDLQKAFDTVDHFILLAKLEAIDLSNGIVKWFQSYLSGRQQLVDVAGTFSSCANIAFGVPQGSILGPLLFLIYVIGMPGVIGNKSLFGQKLRYLYIQCAADVTRQTLKTNSNSLQCVNHFALMP